MQGREHRVGTVCLSGAHCSAVVVEATEWDLEMEGRPGGGGSLIIHQQGCRPAIWGVTGPGGRHPVTRAGSCDLPSIIYPSERRLVACVDEPL